jgi:hypothetical protein
MKGFRQLGWLGYNLRELTKSELFQIVIWPNLSANSIFQFEPQDGLPSPMSPAGTLHP